MYTDDEKKLSLAVTLIRASTFDQQTNMHALVSVCAHRIYVQCKFLISLVFHSSVFANESALATLCPDMCGCCGNRGYIFFWTLSYALQITVPFWFCAERTPRINETKLVAICARGSVTSIPRHRTICNENESEKNKLIMIHILGLQLT